MVSADGPRLEERISLEILAYREAVLGMGWSYQYSIPSGFSKELLPGQQDMGLRRNSGSFAGQ